MAKFHMVQDQSYRDTISYFWSVKKILILMYPSRGWFSDKGSRIRPITTATPLLGLGHLQNQHSIVVQWRSHPHLWSHLWPHPHMGAGSRMEATDNDWRSLGVLRLPYATLRRIATILDAPSLANWKTIFAMMPEYGSVLYTRGLYKKNYTCMLLHVLHLTNTYLLYPTAFLC